MTLRCPYCERPAELVSGDAIYPHRPDLFGFKFWLCEPCGAYVGTHKNSKDHAPLGRLANAELRRLKQKVHAAFDPWWHSGLMKRGTAYAKLADLLGIEQRECHIGMFSEDRCREALSKLRATPTVTGATND